MRISLLPKMIFGVSQPTFYDTDKVTAIEASAKLHGKLNEIVEDYNKFVDETNKTIVDFVESTEQDLEVFEVALRQEFQDFIDTVNLKLLVGEGDLTDFEDLINRKCKEYLTAAIATNAIKVEAVYNEETESLDYRLTGEVI